MKFTNCYKLKLLRIQEIQVNILFIVRHKKNTVKIYGKTNGKLPKVDYVDFNFYKQIN